VELSCIHTIHEKWTICALALALPTLPPSPPSLIHSCYTCLFSISKDCRPFSYSLSISVPSCNAFFSLKLSFTFRRAYSLSQERTPLGDGGYRGREGSYDSSSTLSSKGAGHGGYHLLNFPHFPPPPSREQIDFQLCCSSVFLALPCTYHYCFSLL
jgi:hypothetical protein